MNIIISSLDPLVVRTVGSYGEILDLDEVKLFISRVIQNPDDVLLTTSTLQENGYQYKIDKIKLPALEKQDYIGYRLALRKPVPYNENGYYLFVNNILITDIDPVNFKLSSEEVLEDEHNPILVVGRTISPVTTQVVAQDAHSQQFQFYLKKKYDGISFIDESKKIFVDYIPVDGMTYDGISLDGSFLSDEIKQEKIEEVPAPYGQTGEWLLLKWDLPYDVTRLAGMVQYAISVVAQNENNREYTWQTLPSSFTVSPNLGFRPLGVNMPDYTETSIAEVLEEVNTIKEDVASLEAITGYQSDTDSDNDEEIILNGGGAE